MGGRIFLARTVPLHDDDGAMVIWDTDLFEERRRCVRIDPQR